MRRNLRRFQRKNLSRRSRETLVLLERRVDLLSRESLRNRSFQGIFYSQRFIRKELLWILRVNNRGILLYDLFHARESFNLFSALKSLRLTYYSITKPTVHILTRFIPNKRFKINTRIFINERNLHPIAYFKKYLKALNTFY